MSTIIQVHHESDQELFVSNKPKYNPKIPYFKRIGFPMTNQSTDILELIGEKYFNNASATWLLWKLVRLCDTKTNMVILCNKELSTTERQRVSAAYSLLNQDNIVIRTKREHYLINPKIFLPKNDSFDEVLEHWLSLGGK
jgi:hypothetical protein